MIKLNYGRPVETQCKAIKQINWKSPPRVH